MSVAAPAAAGSTTTALAVERATRQGGRQSLGSGGLRRALRKREPAAEWGGWRVVGPHCVLRWSGDGRAGCALWSSRGGRWNEKRANKSGEFQSANSFFVFEPAPCAGPQLKAGAHARTSPVFTMPRPRPRPDPCDCFDCLDEPQPSTSADDPLPPHLASARQQPPPKCVLVVADGVLTGGAPRGVPADVATPHADAVARRGCVGVLSLREGGGSLLEQVVLGCGQVR